MALKLTRGALCIYCASGWKAFVFFVFIVFFLLCVRCRLFVPSRFETIRFSYLVNQALTNFVHCSVASPNIRLKSKSKCNNKNNDNFGKKVKSTNSFWSIYPKMTVVIDHGFFCSVFGTPLLANGLYANSPAPNHSPEMTVMYFKSQRICIHSTYY